MEKEEKPCARPFNRGDAVFFSFVFLFIYTQLFQLPFTPYYFEGDHIIVTSNAMRIMGGEVIYKDFFHLASPGTEVLYAALFSVFGVKIWVLNFVILLLGLSMAGLAWYLARQFFTGPLVYLPASILLIVGFRLFYIDGSYRLMSMIFVVAAAALVMSSLSTKRLMLAGAMCGVSSFFMQPRGLMGMAALSLFFIWQAYSEGFELEKLVRKLVFLGLPFVVVVILSQSYFLYQAGFENYWFSLVTFLRKHYPNDPLAQRWAFLTDFPSFAQYWGIYSPAFAVSRYLRIVGPILFFYVLTPYTAVVFLIGRWGRLYTVSRADDSKLMLLCCLSLALFAGMSVLSAVRLSHIAIPGILVLVWLLARASRFRKQIATACLVVLALVGLSYSIQRQMIAKNYLDMPAGRAAFLSEQVFERYKWVGDNTEPGAVFYEAHHPSFYFPFHLVNPTPMYLVRDSDYTPLFQVEAVVEALKKHPPKFIAWPRKWTKPAESRTAGDHLDILWQFISTNYEVRVEFNKPLDYTEYSEGDIEIWERKY